MKRLGMSRAFVTDNDIRTERENEKCPTLGTSTFLFSEKKDRAYDFPFAGEV